ncbi:MAG: 6-phosphogluconolactonase [Vicinamibacterales bacterium]
MDLVVTTPESLRQAMTEAFEGLVARADGPMGIGLSGGGTALLFLDALKQARVDWSRIALFWVDERAVPPDDPQSNFGAAERLLLDPLGASAPIAWRMPAELPDLQDAADRYDETLARELGPRGGLGLAILGIGEDGHIASLFPGHHALLYDRMRTVAVEDSPKPPPRRLSMTLPFLGRSREAWIVALGQRKKPVLQGAITGDRPSTPLSLLLRQVRHATVFTDQAIQLR